MLATYPGVLECAVVGVPHDILGQDLVAHMVTRNGVLDPQDLVGFLLSRLADYKVPRRVRLATQLPRSPMGKILKRNLPPPDTDTLRLELPAPPA